LQANPLLNWRQVQDIFIKCARKVDPTDEDWTTNGAGLHVNHKFGFGLLDASAAVNIAGNYTLSNVHSRPYVSWYQEQTVGVTFSQMQSHTSNMFVPVETFSIEHAIVSCEVKTHFRSDLSIGLISPMGTRSVLASVHHNGRHDELTDYPISWNFTSFRHWEESALGVWSLVVADESNVADSNSFVRWTLTLYGTGEVSNATAPPNTPAPPGPTMSPAQLKKLLFVVAAVVAVIALLIGTILVYKYFKKRDSRYADEFDSRMRLADASEWELEPVPVDDADTLQQQQQQPLQPQQNPL